MEIGFFEREFAKIFNPSSIAVIGASNIPGKWGFVVPMNILGGGYRGKLFMVNPNEEMVLGFPAYPSIGEIEEDLDLVIVAIPASKVPGIVEEAAEKGVSNLLIVASNFSEVGGEGAELERKVAKIANRNEITIIGPNTMGIYSASSSLSALGAPVYPQRGAVGFISQSGNLGVQLLSWGRKRGVGFSRFAGSGNEANTEITDYLQFLGEDQETETIALYMEGVEDGRRFLEVAERITPRKPVIVLKGGKGEQGELAVRSHSGALAGDLELFEGMFEQAGIVVAETSEELMDFVTGFSSLPIPRGGKVAVMTMGGGWGVVAADACDREGLELVRLPDPLIEELDGFLPRYWSRGNPVDIVGNLRRSNHFRVIEALVKCQEVDIVIIMGAILGIEFFINNLVNSFMRPITQVTRFRTSRLPHFELSLWKGFLDSVSRPKRTGKNPEGSVGINPAEVFKWTDTALIHRLESLMSEEGKPIISVTMSERQATIISRFRGHSIYTTPMPERAVRLAAKLAAYSRFRSHKE